MTLPAHITIARNEKGDDEVHRTGCADLRQPRFRVHARQGWGDFTGSTVEVAIMAADIDMAAAFGQEVYQPDPDDQPWTISALHHAPCFVAMLRHDKVTGFDEVGRPIVDWSAR